MIYQYLNFLCKNCLPKIIMHFIKLIFPFQNNSMSALIEFTNTVRVGIKVNLPTSYFEEHVSCNRVSYFALQMLQEHCICTTHFIFFTIHIVA